MKNPEFSNFILLMVGRNPANSPVEVGRLSTIIYRVLAPSQVVGNGISEPSTVAPYKFVVRFQTAKFGGPKIAEARIFTPLVIHLGAIKGGILVP